VSVRTTYYKSKPHFRLSDAVCHRQGRRSAQAVTQAHADGLCPAAIQLHVAPVYRFNGLHSHNPCIYMDFHYSFTDPRGMEGRVSE